MNPLHSSATNSWFTPEYIIEKVKVVLGTIDLDPASEVLANQQIRADTIITEEQDGLLVDWPKNCSVYLNPPGAKKNNKSMSALFWAKLMDYAEANCLKHAIYMGFSLEQLAITQKYHTKQMIQFPLCIPEKRIRFDRPDAKKNAPTHSNVIVYVPGTLDKTILFKDVFSEIGACK